MKLILLLLTTNLSRIQAQDSLNLCESIEYLNTNENVAIPNMAKPNPLEAYTDPTFGTTIRRISNSTPDGGVIRTLYNTMQSWNSDESYLILYHTGTENTGHHLYNGTSYEYIQELDIFPSDLEEVYWDSTNPLYFYYVNKDYSFDFGDLLRYNIETHTKELVTTFDDTCGPRALPGGGNGVQMTSLVNNIIGLRCQFASSASPVDFTFYYSIELDQVSDNLVQIGTGTPYQPWNALQPAPSGERFYLGGSVLNQDLTEVLFELDVQRYSDGTAKPEHSTMGQTLQGTDARYAVAFGSSPNGCDGGEGNGVGSLIKHDLETGTCHVLVGQDNGYGYPHSGVHHSALSNQNPGWIAVTSIGSPVLLDLYLNFPIEAPVLLSELYLVSSDGENICRLAHTRTYGKAALNDENYNAYFGEPHPVISPSGTRILFNSDWYDSGSVDTFVIELPSYTGGNKANKKKKNKKSKKKKKNKKKLRKKNQKK